MTKVGAGIALILSVVFLLSAVSVEAQNDNFKVVEVEVEGNHIASRSLILGVSQIDLGSPLTPTQTTETIRRLYGLDIFSDVSIDAEEVPGGIKVYIVVHELPKLNALTFEGNSKIDSKDLKEDLQLGVGGYISPYLIQKKKNEIKAMYAKKGYFQASVESDLKYNADSSGADLTFKIEEESKVKVEKVIVTGNERVESKQLIGKMRNRKRGFLKSSNFAQDKYDEDLEKVINEFHKLGYIDAYMKSDSMSIDTITNRMTIYLDVYEGPRYYFGNVSFEGNEKLNDKFLEKKQEFSEYDIFDIEKYNSSIEEMYTAYYDIGHLHIQIMDERTTRSDSLIDISYNIEEGLPSHINLVKIKGNRRTRDKVIRRELSSMPGQIFTRELLVRSVRDVMALNFFTNANPLPVNLPNGDVDIEFTVDEKQTGQVSAGAGYNSEDKLVGNVGMGIPNFRGMGQSLNFNIDFGSRRNSYSVSFTEPWLFGRPTLLGTDVYSTNRRWYDEYTEGRVGASLRLGKRLRWPDNYFRVYTSYRFERDRYYDFDDTFVTSNSFKDYYSVFAVNSDNTINVNSSGDTLYATRASAKEPYPGSILEYDEKWHTASRISFNISRDSRNLPEFATSGSDISYTFEKTGGFMGGYWNYTKHSLTAAHFIPIVGNLALAAKIQFGAITSPKGSYDQYTLLSDRFTPGGTAYDGIVRGYDDGTLTPDSVVFLSDTTYIYRDSLTSYNVNINGDNFDNGRLLRGDADTVVVSSSEYYTRVRGNYMMVTNIELQFPIVSQQIYVLGFFDAGNSWLNWSDIRLNPKHLYKSAGLGFRIAVPGIGTIGFDYGYAFDLVRNQDRGWKWHFQIGTTFR